MINTICNSAPGEEYSYRINPFQFIIKDSITKIDRDRALDLAATNLEAKL